MGMQSLSVYFVKILKSQGVEVGSKVLTSFQRNWRKNFFFLKNMCKSDFECGHCVHMCSQDVSSSVRLKTGVENGRKR